MIGVPWLEVSCALVKDWDLSGLWPRIGSLPWHVLVLHSVLEPEGVDELLVQVRRQFGAPSQIAARPRLRHCFCMYLSRTLWASLCPAQRSFVCWCVPWCVWSLRGWTSRWCRCGAKPLCFVLQSRTSIVLVHCPRLVHCLGIYLSCTLCWSLREWTSCWCRCSPQPAYHTYQ
jgi:hypothetical protein